MESEGRRALRVFLMTLGLCVGLVLLAMWIQREPGPPKERKSDLACSHFANVADDAGAGILTSAEVRTKIHEVYDSAYSGTTVKEAARRLLAALTQGEDITEPLVALTEACEALG